MDGDLDIVGVVMCEVLEELGLMWFWLVDMVIFDVDWYWIFE